MRFTITALDMNKVRSGDWTTSEVEIVAKLDMVYMDDDNVKNWAFPIIDKHMRLACNPGNRYVISWNDNHESGVIVGGAQLMDEFMIWLLHEAELEYCQNDERVLAEAVLETDIEAEEADIEAENALNEYERIHGADGELTQRHGCSAW